MQVVAVAGLEGGAFFWDLDRDSTRPTARLDLAQPFSIQSSRDGGAMFVASRGKFHVVDATSFNEIATVPVQAQLGAMRLALRDDGFDLVLNRIGAQDVLFIDGATYDVEPVPVPDEVVSIATVPGQGVAFALATGGLWRVTRNSAELWLGPPPGAYPCSVLYLPRHGDLLSVWQYADGLEVEWIDPDAPPDERYVGSISPAGRWYDAIYLFDDRVVTLALDETDLYSVVELFEVNGRDAQAPLRSLGATDMGGYPGSVVVGDRLVMYTQAPDGAPMRALVIDPATAEITGPTTIPFLGLDITSSSSGRMLVWREGGGSQLQYRLVSATLDTETFTRAHRGPSIPLDFAGVPTVVLPRSDGVVVVDRIGDRLMLVR